MEFYSEKVTFHPKVNETGIKHRMDNDFLLNSNFFFKFPVLI